MPEEVIIESQVADPANSVVESDPAKLAENAGDTGALENVEETDEQKNERVQKEAAVKAEKRANGVQKRIDELTADKHAERKRADELSALNTRILALLEGNKPGQKASTDAAPARDQFENYEDYLDARADWRAEQKVKSSFESATKAQQEAQSKVTQAQSDRELAASYQKRQVEVAKTIPDYHDVMADSEVSVPNAVIDLLKRMPDGPLIAYHMAKQPELAQQFWDAHPSMHGIILGQLSTTLKASSKTSNAPPPGKTTASKPASSDGPPSDPAQYRAWADKHMPK